jgi:hypothetical protein
MASQRDESVTEVLQQFSDRRAALEQTYWKKMSETVARFDKLMGRVTHESEAAARDCEDLANQTTHLMRHAETFYQRLGQFFARPEPRR